MNRADASSSDGGGNAPPWRRGVQLQGPRPTPLSIDKESRKIGKAATAAKPPLPAALRQAPATGNREPVVIYAVSPKTINIDASEFKSIVQRLTGIGSSSMPSSFAGGPVSPAARLAAIEKASPTGRERERERATMSNELDVMGTVDWTETVDLGQIPGILSPAPANLPELPAGMFSPGVESQALFGLGDTLMSPFASGNCFLPSPSSSSGFFTGAVGFSPTPSPVLDFYAIFDP